MLESGRRLGSPAPSPTAACWLPARSLQATQRKWQDSESPRGTPGAWAAGPQQDLCAVLREDEEGGCRGRHFRALSNAQRGEAPPPQAVLTSRRPTATMQSHGWGDSGKA